MVGCLIICDIMYRRESRNGGSKSDGGEGEGGSYVYKDMYEGVKGVVPSFERVPLQSWIRIRAMLSPPGLLPSYFLPFRFARY